MHTAPLVEFLDYKLTRIQESRSFRLSRIPPETRGKSRETSRETAVRAAWIANGVSGRSAPISVINPASSFCNAGKS